MKHRLSSSKEYKCWSSMKDRCLNPNTHMYCKYGGEGITVDTLFVDDFTKFIDEIGMMPNYETRWSVDRIDGSLGYLKGNIRWATVEQQTRNRKMPSNNKSGVTGVYWVKGKCSTTYAVSNWYELTDGVLKKKCKWFNVSKLGLFPAFLEAVKYRTEQIRRLNTLGYDYSDTHGQ